MTARSLRKGGNGCRPKAFMRLPQLLSLKVELPSRSGIAWQTEFVLHANNEPG